MMAVSCGTPTPGDDARGADRARTNADLDGVGAGIDQRLRASVVATLPAITCTAFDSRLIRLTASSTPRGVAVRGVDHDHVDAGLDQLLGALEPVVADGGGGRDPQAALLVLAGQRIGAPPSRCPSP